MNDSCVMEARIFFWELTKNNMATKGQKFKKAFSLSLKIAKMRLFLINGDRVRQAPHDEWCEYE